MGEEVFAIHPLNSSENACYPHYRIHIMNDENNCGRTRARLGSFDDPKGHTQGVKRIEQSLTSQFIWMCLPISTILYISSWYETSTSRLWTDFRKCGVILSSWRRLPKDCQCTFLCLEADICSCEGAGYTILSQPSDRALMCGPSVLASS